MVENERFRRDERFERRRKALKEVGEGVGVAARAT